MTVTPFHSASSDLERTKILCRETLAHVGPELLEAYWVIRKGERVQVLRGKLTRDEMLVIAETLREMGEQQYAEGKAMQRETEALLRSGKLQ